MAQGGFTVVYDSRDTLLDYFPHRVLPQQRPRQWENYLPFVTSKAVALVVSANKRLDMP